MRSKAVLSKTTLVAISLFMLFVMSRSICAQAPSLTSWYSIANPPGRSASTAIYDEANDRMILFGGAGYEGVMDDVWALAYDGESNQIRWYKILLDGPEPGARNAHQAVYDPNHGVMYMFGGRDSNANPLNDVWKLDLTLGHEVWEEVKTTGISPSPRWHSTVIYDSSNGRLIVYGGRTQTVWYGDVWELDLETAQWSELSPAGDWPGTRSRAGGVYVAEVEAMLLFAGDRDPYQYFNDMWALYLKKGQEQWVEMSTTGDLPDPRGVDVIDYDDIGKKLVMHGGWAFIGGFVYYNDTWVLDSDLHWTKIISNNEILARRGSRGIFYRRGGDEYLVVFGGSWYPGGVTYFGDTFVMPLP